MTRRGRGAEGRSRQRMADGQGELDLGLNTAGVDSAPLEIMATGGVSCGMACAGLRGARLRSCRRRR